MHARMKTAIRLRSVPSREVLTAEENARALARLRRLWKESGKTQAEFAEALGVAQPALSRTLNEVHGVGLAMLRAMADFEGVSMDAILRTPRERAAELAREDGMPAAAIAAALAEPDVEGRGVLSWLERMRAHATLAASTARKP